MKKGNVFWGLIFILAAVVVILNSFGFGFDIDFWEIAFTIILIACLIKSIASKNIFGVLFSIAFLLIVYDEELHIEQLAPWPVLCAALFGSIGLSMLFGNRGMKRAADDQYFTAAENIGDSDMNFEVNFGSTIKNVNSDDFKSLKASCSFGGMKIYLQNAMIQGERAVVHLQVSFGGVELYIPKEWQVINQINASVGGVTEKNQNLGTNGKQLILTGDVAFAGVEIYYV